MSWFVQPSTEKALGLIADKMVENPVFAERFDAIKELRDDPYTYDDVGRISRANGFVRVASFVGPLLDLAQVLDPEFLAAGGKKRFYKFLDEHKEYCTYDRRKQKLPNQVTFVNGESVL